MSVMPAATSGAVPELDDLLGELSRTLWKQRKPFPACALFFKIVVSSKYFFHKLTGAVLTEQQL